MKPFNPSEFISNQETPVFTRNGTSVEIVTTKGRNGQQPVLGYPGESVLLYTWRCDGAHKLNGAKDPWDLFFATKLEVVHVFKHKDKTVKEGFIVAHSKRDIDFWLNEPCYDHLGTITGPIVPPEKESGVVK